MTNQINNLHSSPPVFTQVPILALRTENVKQLAVYNLAVSDKEEFVANGILVHNCNTCKRYNGKVKRASYWEKIGARPQSPDLECKGINCDCKLEPTTEKLSRGYLTPPP